MRNTMWILFAVLLLQVAITQVLSGPVPFDADDESASSAVDRGNLVEIKRHCRPGDCL